MSRLALTCRRSVPCVVLLALATGCSEDSDEKVKLSPVMGQNGVITYQYLRTEGAIREESDASRDLTDAPQDSEAQQKQRNQDELAYQDSMRKLQQLRAEQAIQDRQDQQDQANLDALRKNLRDQARQEQRDWQNQQSQRAQQQNERIQTEALQLRQTSQKIDDQLRSVREQQQRDQQLLLKWHR